MRRLARASCGDEKANVDLTPMLDVVFIMLIFFIITASFLKESSLPIDQPDPSDKKTDGISQNLVINIDGRGEIEVENRRVDIRSVRSLVSRYMAENPSGAIIIRAHEWAATEKYVNVADQIQRVTKGNYVLVTYSDS